LIAFGKAAVARCRGTARAKELSHDQNISGRNYSVHGRGTHCRRLRPERPHTMQASGSSALRPVSGDERCRTLEVRSDTRIATSRGRAALRRSADTVWPAHPLGAGRANETWRRSSDRTHRVRWRSTPRVSGRNFSGRPTSALCRCPRVPRPKSRPLGTGPYSLAAAAAASKIHTSPSAIRSASSPSRLPSCC
jgi:hypothetical protein